MPELKRQRAQHRRRVREARRMHIHVHHAGAVWSTDAAQMGRDALGPVRAEIVRDVGGRRTPGMIVAKSITHAMVIAALERARDLLGGLPLVVVSDNGPENVNHEIARYFRENRVIHLRSLPRIPQHNPWAEHTIGELRG